MCNQILVHEISNSTFCIFVSQINSKGVSISSYIPVFTVFMLSDVRSACKSRALHRKWVSSGHINIQITHVVMTLVPSPGTLCSLHGNMQTAEVVQNVMGLRIYLYFKSDRSLSVVNVSYIIISSIAELKVIVIVT